MKIKNLSVKVTLLVLCIIVVITFIPNESYKFNTNVKDPKKLTGFEKLKLTQSSIFDNVHEQTLLLGKHRNEIEEKYKYMKTEDNPFIAEEQIYFIDDCTAFMYNKDGVVYQITSNYFSFSEINCFEDISLDENKRIELFGRELKKEIEGDTFPGLYNYVYINDGFSIITVNDKLLSIWITFPSSLKDYENKYSDFSSSLEMLLNLGYNPVFSPLDVNLGERNETKNYKK